MSESLRDLQDQIDTLTRKIVEVERSVPRTQWCVGTDDGRVVLADGGIVRPAAAVTPVVEGLLHLCMWQGAALSVIAGPQTPTPLAPSGIVLASGWAIYDDWDYATRWGPVAQIYLAVERTGAAIPIPTSGDHTNTTVGTMPVGMRPMAPTALASGLSGRNSAWGLNSSGLLTLAAVAGTGDITTGARLSVGGTYLIGG